LEMIRQSSVYQETIYQKSQIEKDFLAIKPVSTLHPYLSIECMKCFDPFTRIMILSIMPTPLSGIRLGCCCCCMILSIIYCPCLHLFAFVVMQLARVMYYLSWDVARYFLVQLITFFFFFRKSDDYLYQNEEIKLYGLYNAIGAQATGSDTQCLIHLSI